MSEIKEKTLSPGENGQLAAVRGPRDDGGDEGYATLQKPLLNGGKRPSTSSISAPMDTDERRSDEPVKLSFEKGTCEPNRCKKFDWQPQLQIASFRKQLYVINHIF